MTVYVDDYGPLLGGGQGSWLVQAVQRGGHVHVNIRVPGRRGARPLAGTLIVDVGQWPDLEAALEHLPAAEIEIELWDDEP